MADKEQLNTGAQLSPVYHSATQRICPVPLMDIIDVSSSAKEETVQAATGSFLFSGAFWLAIERTATVGIADPVVMACGACIICGGVLAWSGYRQSLRRITRLERYIPENTDAE